MLNKLITLLRDNTYYFEKELKEIPCSCCPDIHTRVISFDEVKEKFSRQFYSCPN
jgi:hypothetical protein